MASIIPSIADIALAIALGLLGGGVGVLTGRLVPLFRLHEPGPEDESGPPPPACPSCDTQTPFVRWAPLPRARTLVLRGQCPHCDSAVPRDRATMWSTAVAFALVGLTSASVWDDRSWWEMAALVFFCATGVLLSAVDLRVKRLPNAILGPSYLIAAALLLAAAVASADFARLLDAFIGLAGLTIFYWILWFIYPAGMGWGDVKLAGLLGLYLGWESLSSLISATFLASLFQVLIGLVLMAMGRATRKSQLPFGPLMILGALVVILGTDPLPLLFP